MQYSQICHLHQIPCLDPILHGLHACKRNIHVCFILCIYCKDWVCINGQCNMSVCLLFDTSTHLKSVGDPMSSLVRWGLPLLLFFLSLFFLSVSPPTLMFGAGRAGVLISEQTHQFSAYCQCTIIYHIYTDSIAFSVHAFSARTVLCQCWRVSLNIFYCTLLKWVSLKMSL